MKNAESVKQLFWGTGKKVNFDNNVKNIFSSGGKGIMRDRGQPIMYGKTGVIGNFNMANKNFHKRYSINNFNAMVKDSDRDGVINGLDCMPFNRFKHNIDEILEEPKAKDLDEATDMNFKKKVKEFRELSKIKDNEDKDLSKIDKNVKEVNEKLEQVSGKLKEDAVEKQNLKKKIKEYEEKYIEPVKYKKVKKPSESFISIDKNEKSINIRPKYFDEKKQQWKSESFNKLLNEAREKGVNESELRDIANSNVSQSTQIRMLQRKVRDEKRRDTIKDLEYERKKLELGKKQTYYRQQTQMYRQRMAMGRSRSYANRDITPFAVGKTGYASGRLVGFMLGSNRQFDNPMSGSAVAHIPQQNPIPQQAPRQVNVMNWMSVGKPATPGKKVSFGSFMIKGKAKGNLKRFTF